MNSIKKCTIGSENLFKFESNETIAFLFFTCYLGSVNGEITLKERKYVGGSLISSF